jgi:hypothetical protein
VCNSMIAFYCTETAHSASQQVHCRDLLHSSLICACIASIRWMILMMAHTTAAFGAVPGHTGFVRQQDRRSSACSQKHPA